MRAELVRDAPPHDRFVQLIIIERVAKALILIILAVGLVIVSRTGLLYQWADEAQRELLLATDASLVVRLIDRALVFIGFYKHPTTLALVVIAYALLEGTEGVGLYMRRRWAEYLTVFATGLLIPYEIWEVIHRVTLFKVGGLILNAAVVAYLGYRKRLFVGV